MGGCRTWAIFRTIHDICIFSILLVLSLAGCGNRLNGRCITDQECPGAACFDGACVTRDPGPVITTKGTCDGGTILCVLPSKGICWQGLQTCEGEQPGNCIPLTSSLDVSACGPLCEPCGLSGDRCDQGSCRCGTGASCPSSKQCINGGCIPPSPIIVNGDFSQGFFGWVIWDLRVVAGTNAAQLNPGEGLARLVQDVGQVSPNRIYEISFQVATQGISLGSGFFQLLALDPTSADVNRIVGLGGFTPSSTQDWTTYTFKADTQNGSALRLYIGNWGGFSGGRAFITNVKIADVTK